MFCPSPGGGVTKIRKDRAVTFHEGDDLFWTWKEATPTSRATGGDIADGCVALCRAHPARSTAVILWGNFTSGGNSAPAHLLGNAEPAPRSSSKEKEIALAKLRKAHQSLIGARDLREARLQPASSRAGSIAPMGFPVSLVDQRPGKGGSSPTSIVSGSGSRAGAAGDRDAARGCFAFPRGTQAGHLSSSHFEELDFAELSNMPATSGKTTRL